MRPFVKWAGGKSQLLQLIKKKIFDSTNSVNRDDYTFIEPFVGGGAVFLNKKPERLIINDLNRELMTAYKVIRNNPTKLMDMLDIMYRDFQANKEGYYYSVRQEDRLGSYKGKSDLDIAARMIFLNKTCYNGLYRVNSEGFFNTPLGRNNLLRFYDRKNLLAISRYLNKIPEENIMCGSYINAMERAKAGDIVYIDPPYDYTENDGFTKYQKEGFSYEDLKEFRSNCDKCLDREAFIIVSNNDTKKVRTAFSNDNEHTYLFYSIETIETKRMINCKGNNRNNGKEIIIWGVPNKFPQCTDISRMIQILKIRDKNKIVDIEYLYKRFKLSTKNISESISTLKYFGFIDGEGKLTKNGEKIRKKGINSSKVFKEAILKRKLFYDVYTYNKKDTENKMPIEAIADMVSNDVSGLNKSIASKRAKIVTKIVDWCLAN